MAVRHEKTNTGVDIVIDGFENGISEDPFSGIQDMRQVNLLTMPKAVMVGYPITTSTISGATLGQPISKATEFSFGSADGYYILDSSGQVFKATTFSGTWTYLASNSSTTSHTSHDALWFWKGFLFKTRGTAIDYWSGATWVNGWNPSTGGSGATGIIVNDTSHQAITPINDKVYFCNGQTIGSITEVGTFDPTSSGTYNFNSATFTLPAFDVSQSIAQLGTGTSTSTITVLVGGSQNVIYPFLSTGTSFQTPIFIADYFIKKMVSVNQSVFIFPGNAQSRGRIYITNSVQAQQYFKIPDSVTGYNDPYYDWGDVMFHRNSLVFSFFANKNDGSGTIAGMSDVWALDLDTKAYRSISNLTSAAGYSNATVLIPDQSNNSAPGYAYIVGWTDNSSTNSIGRSSTTSGIGSSIIKTDQISVGTYFNKYTFTQAEIKLQTPLQSGESVILTGISDTSTSAVIATINTVGALSGQGSATFDQSQWLQFQLSLTGNSQTSGCRIREIRIHGNPII